ncbi:MAG: hypothetical protein CBD76_00390 [Pelagibacteraceae bacterium TMED216]|nr:MAG: hypothetical protein CBD76_00390 [Pelagibacteraceae bacterium TMED216]
MMVNNYLTSNNLAKHSDLIYSEILTTEEYKDSNLAPHTIIDRTDRFVFYRIDNLKIANNSIIFTNSLMIEAFFNDIKNIKNIKNIKLISSQTDRLITEKLFRLKPKLISKWYSVNIGYEDEDLISLPLGLANEYSPKNPFAKDFAQYENTNENKIEKLYLNFNPSTNLIERGDLFSLFENKDWAVVDKEMMSINGYLSKLNEYKFILCPFGNGIDTHRIWETLYSGSIPVVKKNIALNSLRNLPVIFYDDIKEINLKFLKNKCESIEKDNFNLDDLLVDTWINKIKNNEVVDVNDLVTHRASKAFYFYFKNIMKIKSLLNKINKKIKFRINQINKVIGR